MELMQEKGYSDHSREEEEEELQEEEEELLAESTIHKESSIKQQQYYPFSSSSNSPSTSNQWLGMLHPHPHPHHNQSPEAATTPTSESHNSSSSSSFLGLHHQEYAPNSSNSNRKLDFMDLSLGNKNDVVEEASNFHATNDSSANDPIQKEHMFDKVVTPSDVGKLNRLVIPKQHAERFFPLDSSTNEKGLLLNFEDRTGKLWRFRYSYWNSSQSYVMTKGWSRFVKEKKLDAGDIVSFQRGAGELYRHRLYIDWRRRPDHAANTNTGIGFHHHLHHQYHSAAGLITPLLLPTSSQYSVRWGGRLYSLPPGPAAPANYHNYPFQQRQNHLYGGSHGSYNNNELNLGSGSLYYYRSPAPGDRSLREGGSNVAPMIIDSVPVAHGKSGSGGGGGSGGKTDDSAGKRLRLFGVNMECSSSSSSLPSPNNLQYLRESHEEEEGPNTARFGDQKGETSVLFDLTPSSFRHRQ